MTLPIILLSALHLFAAMATVEPHELVRSISEAEKSSANRAYRKWTLTCTIGSCEEQRTHRDDFVPSNDVSGHTLCGTWQGTSVYCSPESGRPGRCIPHPNGSSSKGVPWACERTVSGICQKRYCPAQNYKCGSDSQEHWCIPLSKEVCDATRPCADPKKSCSAKYGICLPKEAEQCQNYAQIDREKAQCGSNGYPLRYGLKYCEKFFLYYDSFDATGQSFIKCTAKCLLDKMNEYLTQVAGSVDCAALQRAAFSSHTDCYNQCDFCSAASSSLQNIEQFWDVYEVKDLDAGEMTRVTRSCSEQWIVRKYDQLTTFVAMIFH